MIIGIVCAYNISMQTQNNNNKKEKNTMTTRELRQMLFNVKNQDLTVRELRQKLFEVVAQDEKISGVELTKITWEEEGRK